VVVIAGAGNGIGRACALRFAREGARCLTADVDAKGLAATNELIERAGGACESYVFDIGKKAEVEEAVQKMLQRNRTIHVLVNSAGIAREGDFVDISEKDLLQTLQVNLAGAFFLAQPIVRHMIGGTGRSSTFRRSRACSGARAGPTTRRRSSA
jgi:NAD(P)-dependent dehydrogenase (short-subunit alcohol dehydrogenase family)